MKEKVNIIFDLDGTIIDSQEGILGSARYALEQLGVPIPPKEQLRKFIGPPLLDSFLEYCDFSEEKAKQAITLYRKVYSEKGLFQNSLYPGMANLLEALVHSGKTLALATTKPQIYAEKILQELHLDQYFTIIVGSELDGRRSDKAELIRYSMEQSGMESLSDTVMIGDTHFDMQGAAQVGTDSIGVLYGFGSLAELKEHHPTHIVKTTTELSALLLTQ